jgi:DNA-binding SARP family transcriptional activator
MDGLTVRLFGKLVVQRADQNIEGLHSSKVLELFGYLLLNRARPHTRESLATLLWPESTANISRKYLRQAMWQLHLALMDSGNGDGPRLFVIEDNSVRLESPSLFWLDVDVFEQAASEVQGLRGEELDAGRARRLAEAVSLYRGDLLEGWYFDWCICERERLQSMYLTMLDKLMASAEVTTDYEKGLAYGEQILKYDRARERTYQRMMRLQCLAGDRAGALRQFQRCSISLDEELGVRPSRQTLEIYQLIRADRLAMPSSGGRVPAQDREGETDAPASDSSAPLGRLKQLRTLLCEIQHRVQEDIRALDQALRGSPGAAPDLRAGDASEKGK